MQIIKFIRRPEPEFAIKVTGARLITGLLFHLASIHFPDLAQVSPRLSRFPQWKLMVYSFQSSFGCRKQRKRKHRPVLSD